MLRPLKLGRSPYTLLCSRAEAEAVHSLDCMLIEIYVRFLRPVHCPSSPSGPNHYVATAAPVERRRCVVLLRPSTSARRLSGYSTPMAAAVWRGSLDSELLLLLSSLPGQTRGNGNRFSRLGRKKSSILLSAGACCCSSQVSQCVRLLPSLGF